MATVCTPPVVSGPSVEPRHGGERFASVLKSAGQTRSGPSAPSEVAPRPVVGQAEPSAIAKVGATVDARPTVPSAALDRVIEAQRRLDHVLRLAQSGKTFTPAELLALQANVYRASQEIDLAGKVVEKAASGVKQVLQTQV